MNLASNVTVLMPTKQIGSQRPDGDNAAKKKTRVAAYARVSTDSEEQEGSYEIQVQYYTTLISNNPEWEFVGVYADDGISGTQTSKRAGFLKMIEDCRARKIDLILTKSISRFARNTVDCLNYTRELKSLNIAVKFEKENINTLEASGEVMLTIMAAMAQSESESISQNVRLGLKFRNEQGKVMINHNWFLGYTKDENGKLIIDEEQAKVVRRIYRDYLSGMSLKKIVKGLEADGIKNGAGHTKWYDTNIMQILKNEKYIGDALLQKTWTYNVLDKKRRKNVGDAPQFYVSEDHEPIISKETYVAVQQEMQRRSLLWKESHRSHSTKYAFSGIIFCGSCGDLVRRRVWTINGNKKVVWRCAKRLQDYRKCSARKIDEEKLHEMTVRAINKARGAHRLSPDVVAECVSQGLDAERNARVAEIDKQIRELQEQLISLRMGDARVEEIGGKVKELRDEKVAIQNKKVLETRQIREAAAAFEGIGGPLETFDEKYVRSLISKITVFEDRVEFAFKDGQTVVIGE